MLSILQVEGEAFFAPVRPDEVRALTCDSRVVVAVEIAFAWAFDFDYTGSLVGELAGAEGSGDGLFEGDDQGAREGEGGVGFG